MAFGKIQHSLAIPKSATTRYTFPTLALSPDGPPMLVCRHAGDGTPGFKQAAWNAANAKRRAGRDNVITEERIEARSMEDARLIADHCVVSWENVVEDGSAGPAPCIPDKVYEFLCAIITADEGLAMFREFRDWITDADHFRAQPAGDPAELGKA